MAYGASETSLVLLVDGDLDGRKSIVGTSSMIGRNEGDGLSVGETIPLLLCAFEAFMEREDPFVGGSFFLAAWGALVFLLPFDGTSLCEGSNFADL